MKLRQLLTQHSVISQNTLRYNNADTTTLDPRHVEDSNEDVNKT
jgi:hypothetical protein